MVCETPNQDNILTKSKKCSEPPMLPVMYVTIEIVTLLGMQGIIQLAIRIRENMTFKVAYK
jgi:hypothetical protein